MPTILIGIVVYLLIGVGVSLWSIKDDHSGSWALALPWIIPVVVIGYPYFLLKRIFKPDK